jgi:hypothetical protein
MSLSRNKVGPTKYVQDIEVIKYNSVTDTAYKPSGINFTRCFYGHDSRSLNPREEHTSWVCEQNADNLRT